MKIKRALIICIISIAVLVAVVCFALMGQKGSEITDFGGIADQSTNEAAVEEVLPTLDPKLTVRESISLSADRDYLIMADYEGFGDLSFRSSDETIAVVSEDGMVTGIHPGQTNIAVMLSADGEYRSWSKNVKVTVTGPDISKTIFLTYDDGPSGNITPELLDVLKSHDAHATFFIIGNYAKLHPEIVKRAFDEGHTIAIHTYTHDYKKIYSGVDAYIEDFDETEALIEEITGKTPRFWRFPGGSNNGYTNSSSQHAIIDKLRERGYTPMDWNVSTTDAAPDYPSAATMVEKGSGFIDQVIASGGTPVVLMHDSETKVNACAATETFITKYGQMGYDFRGLDDYYGDGVLFLK